MSIYDFQVTKLDGSSESLSIYKGKTLLVVNVASRCGFTPQYTGLEKLYQKYSNQGFVVLGFPCNQFGKQEPGTHEEIKSFCTLNYQISFPIFAKVEVNGEKADPLFKYLKKEAPGILGTEAIKWNFTKFLVDKTGKVIKRFASATSPDSIEPEIRALLS